MGREKSYTERGDDIAGGIGSCRRTYFHKTVLKLGGGELGFLRNESPGGSVMKVRDSISRFFSSP